MSAELAPRPEIVVFDLDGTLTDSAADIAKAVNLVLAERGRAAFSVAEVVRHVGEGVAALLAGCLGTDEDVQEAVASFRRHYACCALERTAFYPGMVELLDRLANRRLAVLSNKPEAFCRQVLRGLGALGRFRAVAGADTYPACKPHPRPLLETVRALGGEPASALMVGDGIPDVRAGRAAGVRTCAVLWGFTGREALVAEGPDALAGSVAELGRILGA